MGAGGLRYYESDLHCLEIRRACLRVYGGTALFIKVGIIARKNGAGQPASFYLKA